MTPTFEEKMKIAQKKEGRFFFFLPVYSMLISFGVMEQLIGITFGENTPYDLFHLVLLSLVMGASFWVMPTYIRLKKMGYRPKNLVTHEKAMYYQIVYQLVFPLVYGLTYFLASVEQELVSLLIHFGLVVGIYLFILALHMLFYLIDGSSKEKETEIESKEEVKETFVPTFDYLATSSNYALSKQIVQTRNRLKKMTDDVESIEMQLNHDIELGITLFNQGLPSFEALPENQKEEFSTYMYWTLAYINEQIDDVYRMHNERHQNELMKMGHRLKARG